MSARFGASAVICCIHGIPKKQLTELVYDSAIKNAAECLCCQNVFAYPKALEIALICNSCGGNNDAKIV